MKKYLLSNLPIIGAVTVPLFVALLATLSAASRPDTTTNPTPTATPPTTIYHKAKPAHVPADTVIAHYAFILVDGERCEVRNEATNAILATFTAPQGSDYETTAKRLCPQITAFRIDNELAE